MIPRIAALAWLGPFWGAWRVLQAYSTVGGATTVRSQQVASNLVPLSKASFLNIHKPNNSQLVFLYEQFVCHSAYIKYQESFFF